MPGFQVERRARNPAGPLAIRLWVASILLSRQQDRHVGRPGQASAQRALRVRQQYGLYWWWADCHLYKPYISLFLPSRRSLGVACRWLILYARKQVFVQYTRCNVRTKRKPRRRRQPEARPLPVWPIHQVIKWPRGGHGGLGTADDRRPPPGPNDLHDFATPASTRYEFVGARFVGPELFEACSSAYVPAGGHKMFHLGVGEPGLFEGGV